MNVRFTPRALKQIEAIGRFIAQDNASAAEMVTGRIRALCLLLGDHPYMGHPSNIPSVRTLGMPRDPYRISYEIVALNEVRILQVRHTSRRPLRGHS